MSYMDGLGRVFNIIPVASGLSIPLKEAQAVTFVSFLDAGSQVVTLTQTKQGVSSATLPTITRASKGPGIGGTWTELTQAAAATTPAADATNDSLVFTVGAEQLDVDNSYDCVVATASAGTLLAIVHELRTLRAPSKLARSVV